MLIYATNADLAAAPWLVTEPPANVGRLLAYASQLVRTATRSAIYGTGTDGAPTDATVVGAFKDAVCAQVSTWIGAGINPAQAGGGQSSVVASKSLGPRSVQYAVYERDAAQRQHITLHLTDEAAGYLADLGLCSAVQVHG